MKKLEISQMENLHGGHSWAYCKLRAFDIIVFGWTIYDGPINTQAQWDACRAAQ